MTKSQFLAQMEVMQAQGFEMFKVIFNELDLTEEKADKISIGSDVLEDIVSTIAQEVESDGCDLISDYDLEMHGNEVSLEGIEYSTRRLEETIREVLERYFDTKD